MCLGGASNPLGRRTPPTALAFNAVLVGFAAAAETAAPASGPEPRSGLADAAAGCVAAGDTCLPHCLDLLGKRDTLLAECARTVRQMLVVRSAIGPLADAGSKHREDDARPCVAACIDCEEACKHAHHHAPSERCADARERTITEAKKVLGA